jgi:hypothetical protein
MARKPTTNDLPSIKDAFPAFKGFTQGENKQQAIIRLLRDCARSMQRKDPRPFYPMRQAAVFFGASLRTIAIAYETLDREGALSRIRGSQTLLPGKKVAARQPVNGVIGLPISLQAMLSAPFECQLQIELEERLRVRGFVADSIFFRPSEDYAPAFAERLLKHNLDAIIWHSPHPLASHVLMSLRERGVRLILLQPAEASLRIAARNHILAWHDAYRAMAASWAAAGICKAYFVEPELLFSRRALHQMPAILDEFGIASEVIEATESAVALKFPSTAAALGSTVLGFMDFVTADTLCNGYPELIDRIATHARIAFCRGAVRIPRLVTRRICVDIVDLNPVVLAKEVVADFCDVQNIQDGPRATFQAEYHSQVIISQGLDRH